MKVLPYCATCGKEKEIPEHKYQHGYWDNAEVKHEFEPCVTLKEVKERDERLTKELFSNTSQTIGGVVYELIPRGKYRKVVGELKGK